MHQAGSQQAAVGRQQLPGQEAQETGVIEGLSLTHFSTNAVLVQGGSWRLDKCDISTNRRTARASTAVNIRDGYAPREASLPTRIL